MNAKTVFGMPWWQSALFGAGLGAFGIGVYEALPAPSLDRAQADFEANDSPEQGGGRNWPAFRARQRDAGELVCRDSADKTVRWCTLQTLRIDPLDGHPLGVLPEDFVCSTSGCFWLEHFR